MKQDSLNHEQIKVFNRIFILLDIPIIDMLSYVCAYWCERACTCASCISVHMVDILSPLLRCVCTRLNSRIFCYMQFVCARACIHLVDILSHLLLCAWTRLLSEVRAQLGSPFPCGGGTGASIQGPRNAGSVCGCHCSCSCTNLYQFYHRFQFLSTDV